MRWMVQLSRRLTGTSSHPLAKACCAWLAWQHLMEMVQKLLSTCAFLLLLSKAVLNDCWYAGRRHVLMCQALMCRCRKILRARLWPSEDSSKAWDRSVVDIGGEVLLVSQFTLYGRLNGNRLDFSQAMRPQQVHTDHESTGPAAAHQPLLGRC